MLVIDFAKLSNDLEESNNMVPEEKSLCYDLLFKVTSLDDLANVPTKDLVSAFLYFKPLVEALETRKQFVKEFVERSKKANRIRTNRLL